MIKQESLILSPYIALYDIIIPKDHELRQLADLVDFSFVDDMLKNMYTLDNGRPGYRPQVMFKYLMLKRMYELSDRDVYIIKELDNQISHYDRIEDALTYIGHYCKP